MESWLGFGLILLGVAFVFLGLAGGFKAVFGPKLKASGTGGPVGAQSLTDVSKLLESIAAVIKALTDAPAWIALTVIGIGLVGWGSVLAFSDVTVS